ncbi:MAG: hypothetical protein J0I07_09320 [Myxococcales bacterium]|nr:hypothetical protein [Myxococcales bacterium]
MTRPHATWRPWLNLNAQAPMAWLLSARIAVSREKPGTSVGFASKVTGIEIDVRKLDTYDVAELGTKFDIVLFMGVLYHLRHPLLALDLIHEHVVGDTMIFQSMQRGSHDVLPLTENYPFSETEIFDRAEYPKMHFVENRYSGDETNWWIPNRACVEAMLRSSGFRIETHPEEEVYVCRVEGGER